MGSLQPCGPPTGGGGGRGVLKRWLDDDERRRPTALCACATLMMQRPNQSAYKLLGDLAKLTRWVERPVKLGEGLAAVMAAAVPGLPWGELPRQQD